MPNATTPPLLTLQFFRLPERCISEPTFSNSIWTGFHFASGADAVAREHAFARWAKSNGHLAGRTVELFWFLGYRRGLPRFDERALKLIWDYKVRKHQLLLQHGVWEIGNKGERKLEGAELLTWIEASSPHPGSWRTYFQQKKCIYLKGRERFNAANTFWKKCPRRAQKTILLARHYKVESASWKTYNIGDPYVSPQEQSYPDYFVVFRSGAHAFVEVKRFGDSLRPNQQRFFPELIRNASQRILVVRIDLAGKSLRWFRIKGDKLERIDSLQAAVVFLDRAHASSSK